VDAGALVPGAVGAGVAGGVVGAFDGVAAGAEALRVGTGDDVGAAAVHAVTAAAVMTRAAVAAVLRMESSMGTSVAS
jgi:hypothetical protein